MSFEGALRDGRATSFALFETMRWEPGYGLIRKDLHLGRMAGSAASLGFAYDRKAIDECLDQLQGHPDLLRVRLELRSDGSCDLTHHPFATLPEATVWTLRIARTRLDEKDALLRHKTTRRLTYETARAEYPPEAAEEVVLLNGAAMVCEGTITNIFVKDADGMLHTPPLSAGLLPGVLRAELLASGRARETELTVADLSNARKVLVGNSLRGLIHAKLNLDLT